MDGDADQRMHRVWIGNGVATFIISCAVFVIFAGFIIILAIAPQLGTALSAEQRGAVLGVLIAQFTSTVQYWIGSSIGSQNKSIELAGVKDANRPIGPTSTGSTASGDQERTP